MINLIRFILGYVKVIIIGENPEIFINHLISRNITVWNIKPKNNTFVLCVLNKDYQRLRKIRSELSLRYRTRIIQKFGLKTKIKNSRIRSGVSIGLILVILINLFLSNFIWQIEVVGTKQISKDEVLNICNQLDIKKGIYSKKIDTYDMSHQIALKTNKIAWMSLNIEGSKLTINISEDNGVDKGDTAPSNIVAIRDGTIHSIIENRGTQNVKIGQAVRKGEVLISCVETAGDLVRYVFASGEVIADTQHKFFIEIDKNYKYKEKNYLFKTKKAFEFFGIKFPLYLVGVDDYYNSFVETKSLKLFNKELPISVIIRSFIYNDINKITVSEKDAVNIALASFEEELRKIKILSVLDTKVTVNEDNDKYGITINALCRENIGENKAVDFLNY